MLPLATEIPLNLKAKGDLAELMVAVDLLRRGHKIAIPYGEDCDFDLVLIRATGWSASRSSTRDPTGR
jgi:hypothetical protein